MQLALKFFLVFLAAALINGAASAQQFTVTMDSTQGTGLVDSLAVFHGRITNDWDQTNTIHWVKTVDVPEGWQVEICQTSLTCWPDFVYEEDMVFPGNAVDELLVKFYPNSEGEGHASLSLTPTANHELAQTFNFTFRANAQSAPRMEDPDHKGLRFTFESPFGGATGPGGRISGFRLPGAASVNVELFDIQGRLLATLWTGVADSGAHRFTLPGDLKTGAYIVRLEAGGYPTIASKVVMMR